MRIGKRIGILLITLSSIFAASCVKQDVSEKIDADGNASIKASVEITMKIPALSGSTDSGDNDTSQTKDMCKDFDKAKFIYLKDPVCKTLGEGKMEISGSADLKSNNWFASTGSIFVYNLKSTERILSNNALTNDSSTKDMPVQSQEESEKQAANAKQMGFEVNISIEMPGEIIRSDIGSFTGNTLKIDGFELGKVFNAYVISKTPGAEVSESEINAAIRSVKIKRPLILRVLKPRQVTLIKKIVSKNDSAQITALIKKIDAMVIKLSESAKTKAQIKKINMLKDIRDILDGIN